MYKTVEFYSFLIKATNKFNKESTLLYMNINIDDKFL